MILDSKILIPYLDLEIGFNVQFSIGLSMQIIMNQNITYFKFEIKISALINFGYLSLYIASSYINQYTYARKSLLF